MMRQNRKQTLTIMLGALHLLGSLVLAAPTVADGLVPRFVTDPLTGVAMDGYDPVTYFTDADPLPGKPDYEYDWAGVPWYFTNPANRDVFIRAPQTYAPQFGGHATMALAGGYLSDGNPQIYLVIADRLYLFYSAANRDAFELAPQKAIADARAHWADFSKTMAPLPPDTATAAAPAATAPAGAPAHANSALPPAGP